MKHLKDILEGILDSGFDVADDDVNPLKYFVEKYVSKYPRFGHKYIYSKWKIEEMEAVLKPYGKFVGTMQQIDADKLLSDSLSKKQTIVLLSPYSAHPEFYIFVPESKRSWTRYTCDFDYPEPQSVFDGWKNKNTNEIRSSLLFTSNLPSKVYVLRDDQFLKDLRKYITMYE